VTGTPGDSPVSGDAAASGDEDDDWPTRYSWLEDDETDKADDRDDKPSDADEPATPTTTPVASEPAEPGEVADTSAADTHDEPGNHDAGGEPSAAETPSGVRLVTVVPGVPRYHNANCILIRFMPETDVQSLTIPEARNLNCTPCAACQPED
jgi:hypothetical protein